MIILIVELVIIVWIVAMYFIQKYVGDEFEQLKKGGRNED